MNLFDAIFDKKLSAVALIHEGHEITYEELRDDCLQTAQAFCLIGVIPGERVALLLRDSPEFVAAFIATCSMGAIAVPINLALRPPEQVAILSNSGARFVVVERDYCNTLLTGAKDTLHPLSRIVTVERNGSEFDFESLKELKRQASTNQLPAFKSSSENEAAFILYTSGSTGDPKGAVHTQNHIFYTNDSFCREVLKVIPSDRLFSSSRLPFAYGLGNSFTFPLLNGATSIICTEKPTPEVISRIFSQSRPTIFFGVPVVYNLLLDHHRNVDPLDTSSLRLCVSAGEALPAYLGEEWQKEFGVPLLDGIGSTEMLHMFMSNHEHDIRYGSSGKLLEGYRARLTNENGEPVAGEGNLWIQGDSAATGYWEKPEETDRTFVDGWVRTGDLYRQDSDGYWFHMGRSDDCFKSSGQWVSPVEVEGVLIRHKQVARVAVVADFDAEQLPCACAFIVCSNVECDSDVVEQELRELAATALPRFKQPKRYVFVSELPYTATGKIQRFKLRASAREA